MQGLFRIYGTEECMWVRVDKMNFTDDAKCWYPLVESTLQTCSWSTFTRLILERFGQDEHELLLRQLFQIHQTTSVNEYITQFTPLINQLNAYGGTTDALFYTMRFVDGLKDYIRAAIALHRPQNFDTACILARLQEEVTYPAKKRDLRHWDNASGMRPLPLPALPPQLALPVPQAKPVPDGGRGPSTEDRWSTLHASRCAQGLCIVVGSGLVTINAPKRFRFILCKSFLMYCKWKTLKSLTTVL